MTVQRDQITRRWVVVDADGTTVEDGFRTAAAARRWADDRCDQTLEATRDRVRNAMRAPGRVLGEVKRREG
jgi:hypothetical protein